MRTTTGISLPAERQARREHRSFSSLISFALARSLRVAGASDSEEEEPEVAHFTANTDTGRIEAFRVRPEAAGLARLAALVHRGKPGLAEPPGLAILEQMWYTFAASIETCGL